MKLPDHYVTIVLFLQIWALLFYKKALQFRMLYLYSYQFVSLMSSIGTEGGDQTQ